MAEIDKKIEETGDPTGYLARQRQQVNDNALSSIEKSQKAINDIHNTAAELSRYTGKPVNASLLDDEESSYKSFRLSKNLLNLIPGSSTAEAILVDGDPKQAAINFAMEGALWYVGGRIVKRGGLKAGSVDDAATKNIPTNATDTLTHINKTGNVPPGYKGGKTFNNDGRGGGEVLPKKDAAGNLITYKEYDVNPYQKGVNRGAERIVKGSDGKTYYTNDHYNTFTPIE